MEEAGDIKYQFSGGTSSSFEETTWMNSSTPGPLSDKPKWKQNLHLAHQIILTLILLYLMLAMGCTISLQEIWCHIKKPTGIIIGVISQFVLMPLLSFGLAHALNLTDIHALGMLVLATSPGGGLSNIFTYWVDGDVSLSICMTSVSTGLALGMMPLNLFIYSRSWSIPSSNTSETLHSPANTIPYERILITLVSILGPVAVGILIRRKYLKLANILAQLGSAAGLLAILTVISMQSVLYEWHNITNWRLWLGASIHPLAGYFCGYLLAWICRVPTKLQRTVAFETGCQNVALALSVIALSFSVELRQDLIIYPILFGIFMPIDAVVFVIGFKIYKKYSAKENHSHDKDNLHPENKSETEGTKNSAFTIENDIINKSCEDKNDANKMIDERMQYITQL